MLYGWRDEQWCMDGWFVYVFEVEGVIAWHACLIALLVFFECLFIYVLFSFIWIFVFLLYVLVSSERMCVYITFCFLITFVVWQCSQRSKCGII